MNFFCCSFHSTIINISKYLQHVFSLESLERTWLGESQFKELDIMGWQAIGFLYEFLHGIIGVLMGQATCIAIGKVLLRIGVQFPYKLLPIYNLGMCFRRVEKKM